jgi:hypothetical protein
MREVALKVVGRGDPLVHLDDVHLPPRKRLVGQRAQHQPRGAAATDRHDVAPARGHRGAHVGGDDRCRLAGDCIVIGVDFDLHATNSGPGSAIGLPW